MSKKTEYKNVSKQDLVSLDAILETLKDRRKLLWLNFKAGFVRGFAGVFGAAVAILIIGLMVTYLGGIPFIGEFINKIGEAVTTSK